MLLRLVFDIIIVMSDRAFQEIEKEIERMGIDVPVIPCSVLSIPEFDFDKYVRIKKKYQLSLHAIVGVACCIID